MFRWTTRSGQVSQTAALADQFTRAGRSPIDRIRDDALLAAALDNARNERSQQVKTLT
jgi:hypothetical protein